MKDCRPDMPYGVICHTHGFQGLTRFEYMRQLDDADSLWKCPICGDASQWDDDRYETMTDERFESDGPESITALLEGSIPDDAYEYPDEWACSGCDSLLPSPNARCNVCFPTYH